MTVAYPAGAAEWSVRPVLQAVHRFIPDPAGPERAMFLDAAQLSGVKRIVRELLRLTNDTPVIVAEVACADAACPLIETVIGVFPPDEPPRRWRLTRPRAALTRMMLAQTLATPPERSVPPVGER